MNENRTMLFIVLAIIIIGAGILYILDLRAAKAAESQVEFDKGNRINKETFLALLAEKKPVYIVMDARNVSDNYTKRNIFQCGVDFAGSSGLVGREVYIVAMEDAGCVLASPSRAINRTATNSECIKMLNSGGIAVYSHAGNDTLYYSRAAMVGVGDTYVLGSCSIGQK